MLALQVTINFKSQWNIEIRRAYSIKPTAKRIVSSSSGDYWTWYKHKHRRGDVAIYQEANLGEAPTQGPNPLYLDIKRYYMII
jgi:hypothetical protein